MKLSFGYSPYLKIGAFATQTLVHLQNGVQVFNNGHLCKVTYSFESTVCLEFTPGNTANVHPDTAARTMDEAEIKRYVAGGGVLPETDERFEDRG